MHLIGCEFLRIKDSKHQPHIASCVYYGIIVGLTGAEKMITISSPSLSTIVKGHDHQWLCSMELKA